MLIDRGALLEVDGRWVRGAGRGRHRRAADDPCAARGAAGSAGARRARDRRAGVGDRAGVPADGLSPRWRPTAVRPALGEHLATLTRKQFVHLSMAVDAERTLPLSPPAGARHRLQRPAQAGARAAAHRVRALGRRVNAERDRALEFEEILGYHLEQAHRYLSELGPLDEDGHAVGADGAQRLSRRRAGAPSRAATCMRRRTCIGAPSRCSAEDDPTAAGAAARARRGADGAGRLRRGARRAGRRPRPPRERAAQRRHRGIRRSCCGCSCASSAASRANGARDAAHRRTRRFRCSRASRGARRTGPRLAADRLRARHRRPATARPATPPSRSMTHARLAGRRAHSSRATRIGLRERRAARADAGAAGDRRCASGCSPTG